MTAVEIPLAVEHLGAAMRASVGDHLLVHGHKVGAADRDGEILEIKGPGGEPPYVVRWTDGTSGIVFPSCDADIIHPQAGSSRPV